MALPDVGLFDSAIAGETVMLAARIAGEVGIGKRGPASQEEERKKRIA
ncbi:hypothetical protein H3V53_40340 [Paraburkholderia bengalensis]|uniref:Uncharacterized protein n=1 Tax=Paraburkholderia bengalensis TaxID=2747562 RepID=A0ABU8J6E2_9BURK